ncbi:PLP-dependent transferase [Pleomassaria siparia CBS 279.74]|uniref:PLP-dependent transferase n=1 Tax=Pleomassaria siparia CBS 279.74 TaxID=1314801 RepID=A0A6G1JSQ4_9PLEO|nr:PLP-dependent transferase [Pleomassaria siparia CBS 279.74]
MGASTHDSPLEQSLRALLDRRRAQSTLRTLTLPLAHQVDFSSNDFLSLSTSPLLRSSFLKELTSSSTLPIGSGGSRLLDGNSQYAEELEREIAAFHHAPSGLLFNSGFDANAGFFASVPQPDDVVVYDELVHASVHDGMRLSRASQRVPFAHNCIVDLTRVLSTLLSQSEALRDGKTHVFIAIEAVYSMDGDVAPLKSIVEVVESTLPRGGGYVVVDEAHATGVIGLHGRGLVCELGLEDRVFARLHTFGKALACNGAVILGSELLRHYLINYARPLIYTTFMSYPALAAIRASYGLLIQGHTVALASHLRHLIHFLFEALNTASPIFGHLLSIPSTCPSSPIFSIQTAEPKVLAKFMQDRGMMVRAVVPPTVPEGTSRVRVCLHAGNTREEITKLVTDMEIWALSQTPNMEEKIRKTRVVSGRL